MSEKNRVQNLLKLCEKLKKWEPIKIVWIDASFIRNVPPEQPVDFTSHAEQLGYFHSVKYDSQLDEHFILIALIKYRDVNTKTHFISIPLSSVRKIIRVKEAENNMEKMGLVSEKDGEKIPLFYFKIGEAEEA